MSDGRVHYLCACTQFRGMIKNLLKNIVFLIFWLNSRDKKGIRGQNLKMGGVLTIQGQKVKIPLQSPGKLSNFLFFVPIFHLSLPKI